MKTIQTEEIEKELNLKIDTQELESGCFYLLYVKKPDNMSWEYFHNMAKHITDRLYENNIKVLIVERSYLQDLEIWKLSNNHNSNVGGEDSKC